MRGQVSVEHILIIGITAGLLVVALGLFYYQTQTSEAQTMSSVIDSIGNQIVQTAEQTYVYGPGGRETIEVLFPEGITNVTVNPYDNSEVVIAYDTINGVSEAVFFSDVPLTGQYAQHITYIDSGKVFLQFDATEDGVMLSVPEEKGCIKKVEVVSGQTTTYEKGGTDYPVIILTDVPDEWSAALPGAKWAWKDESNPQSNVKFNHREVLVGPGNIISAWFYVAGNDEANLIQVKRDSGGTFTLNIPTSEESSYTYDTQIAEDVTAWLGGNIPIIENLDIEIRATRLDGDAGLKFRVVMDIDTC
ncbi:hypothetical protein GOV11_02335 [Candidatus Woesearchaeota archaeon]|nr:hypothetical protein [Candidatus Woesearchaeota archaeon]